MANYKKEVRPPGPTRENEPNTIKESLSLYQILKVHNQEQTIKFSGALTQIWYDSRLRWNASEYGNVYFTPVPVEMLWRPDVGLFTSVDDLFDIAENSKNKAFITSKSKVWWRVMKVFTSSCDLHLKYFPFDWQKCDICFSGSTGFSDVLKFTAEEKVDLEFYQRNAEWTLKNATATISEIPVLSMASSSGFIPNMSIYKVSLILQRRSQYYWIHLLAPCVCISALVCFVFVTPPDAGEKISFSVTILLAFTVYQLIIANSLPRGSESVSLMSAYLTALVALSALSVVFSIVVLNIYHRDPRIPLPGCFRMVMFYGVAKLVLKKVPVRATLKTNSVGGHSEEKKASDVNGISDVKNPDVVRVIAANYDDGEANEWKLVAEILDRFLLCLYVITTISVNVIVLLILPSGAEGHIKGPSTW